MLLNKKNIVTTIMLLGLIVPFVFITDLFPFVRFGMFAEPIKSNIQTENFMVYATNKNKERFLVNPRLFGSNENSFLYLCRNYYYRNQLQEFSTNLLSTPPLVNSTKIEIFRISTNINNTRDTTLIGAFNRNE